MFDKNAKRLLEARCLRKDEERRVIESIPQMFERVAINIAIQSILYDRRVYDVSDVGFRLYNHGQFLPVIFHRYTRFLA
ncbi:MAG: hypothetical protein N2Z80_04975 [Hydrogenothermaceae bacterium]|nr:hypothetical protein [Hydrogenothermaceae bacterium]